MVIVRGRLDARGRRAAHAGAGRGARDAVPAGPRQRQPTRTTFPRKRRRWRSSRPTRWRCSRRRRCTTGSIPARRASATRSSSTSTPRCWPTPDQPGQSVLEDGARVSAETSQRLACDASRVVMRHDADGRVVEVGARTRTIPPALRRALHHRDRGCRFPGCGVPFGQGHHIHHWAQGGPTTLSNLALLCRRHHRAVHEEGYQVDRRAGRRAAVPAAGRPARSPTSRRRPQVPDDPVHDPPSAARGGRARRARAYRDAGLAGRAPGRGLGDRRPAPLAR